MLKTEVHSSSTSARISYSSVSYVYWHLDIWSKVRCFTSNVMCCISSHLSPVKNANMKWRICLLYFGATYMVCNIIAFSFNRCFLFKNCLYEVSLLFKNVPIQIRLFVHMPLQFLRIHEQSNFSFHCCTQNFSRHAHCWDIVDFIMVVSSCRVRQALTPLPKKQQNLNNARLTARTS